MPPSNPLDTAHRSEKSQPSKKFGKNRLNAKFHSCQQKLFLSGGPRYYFQNERGVGWESTLDVIAASTKKKHS